MNTTITSAQSGLIAVWNMEGTANASVGGFSGTLVGDAEFRSTPLPLPKQGDVDCNGAVNSIDSLKLLRHGACLSVAQNQPCTALGANPATGA
jgi:hypothetical protein